MRHHQPAYYSHTIPIIEHLYHLLLLTHTHIETIQNMLVPLLPHGLGNQKSFHSHLVYGTFMFHLFTYSLFVNSGSTYYIITFKTMEL